MSSSSASSSTEEEEDSEERLRGKQKTVAHIHLPLYNILCTVFQAKVIEAVKPQQSDESEVELSSQKKIKLQTTTGEKYTAEKKKKKATDGESCDREKDALAIQRQHEQFMNIQAKKAELYVKRKRQLSTVSSKAPVVDTDLQRPGMEGKGPRVVPHSMKNYRKRLKKKVKRSVADST